MGDFPNHSPNGWVILEENGPMHTGPSQSHQDFLLPFLATKPASDQGHFDPLPFHRSPQFSF